MIGIGSTKYNIVVNLKFSILLTNNKTVTAQIYQIDTIKDDKTFDIISRAVAFCKDAPKQYKIFRGRIDLDSKGLDNFICKAKAMLAEAYIEDFKTKMKRTELKKPA